MRASVFLERVLNASLPLPRPAAGVQKLQGGGPDGAPSSAGNVQQLPVPLLKEVKQFLRNHQVPSELFYSACPDETVLNILDDRAFARACARAAAGRIDGTLHQA